MQTLKLHRRAADIIDAMQIQRLWQGQSNTLWGRRATLAAFVFFLVKGLMWAGTAALLYWLY